MTLSDRKTRCTGFPPFIHGKTILYAPENMHEVKTNIYIYIYEIRMES